MKANKTIVSKISIASIAFMMVAGFSVLQAAEHQHEKADAEKGSRNRRSERADDNTRMHPSTTGMPVVDESTW